MLKKSIQFTFLAGFVLTHFSNFSHAGSFLTASKPVCEEVVISVKGQIRYKDSMKSGELGYHHCMHQRLSSTDFPLKNPEKTTCQQVDMQPEVVAIKPPLPHDENAVLPLFQRPNPYYIPDGTACEVKYAQYYFLR